MEGHSAVQVYFIAEAHRVSWEDCFCRCSVAQRDLVPDTGTEEENEQLGSAYHSAGCWRSDGCRRMCWRFLATHISDWSREAGAKWWESGFSSTPALARVRWSRCSRFARACGVCFKYETSFLVAFLPACRFEATSVTFSPLAMGVSIRVSLWLYGNCFC